MSALYRQNKWKYQSRNELRQFGGKFELNSGCVARRKFNRNSARRVGLIHRLHNYYAARCLDLRLPADFAFTGASFV